MDSILRVTFGRLAKNSIAKVTIGHIDIQDVVDVLGGRRKGHTGGYAGKHKQSNLGVRFIPFTDEFKKQRLREDKEIIDLVLTMIEGNLI